MPQERLPKQALHAKANGRRPVGRPRTRWTDYIEDLGWNRLGLRPSEMMEVMEDLEVWRLNLELLPPQPSRKSGQRRKKQKKEDSFRSYVGIVACTATLSINGCYFLAGITNSSADGVVAFYPTARLHYKELFYAQSWTALFRAFSSHRQPVMISSVARSGSRNNFPGVDHEGRQTF